MIGFLTALAEERVAVRKSWQLKPAGTLQGLELEVGPGCVHLCTGMGEDRVKEGVRILEQVYRPSLIVLVGFSVGLRESLQVGDLVCDERSEPALVIQLGRTDLEMAFTKVATCNFLTTAKAKASAAQASGASLVADLETEAFLTDRQTNSAVLAFRSVSDGLQTDLPLDFSRYVDARGFPDHKAIALSVALRPWLIPRMLKLAKDAAVAAEALADLLRQTRSTLESFDERAN